MKKKVYTEYKAEQFLKRYLPVAKSVLCKDIDTAIKFSKKNGFPVVLKIISKDALHKSDIGGVKTAKDKAELHDMYDELLKLAGYKKMLLDGILIQEYVSGKELVIGIKNDSTFGHVIMFGVGGIFVEVFKDVTFRKCPITLDDAQSMVDELKSNKLLYGVRGERPINTNSLKKLLVKASKIPLKNKDIEELDINPLIANDKIVKVADARIVFGK